ncbi:iron-sulfur cluster assembly protein [Pseudonocardia sp. EV170527-09]|uniref:iron-sulfur cluster assembly protein n=1 Tax=unclassified Pseudonocardia TaxID=2619320 RepID=UPI0005C2983D|nr:MULTISPECIES: iron-sulfur cluster assembly protein [unclassified Pseudonocardia]ALE85908.1 metal-sulfur cluster biosynthetic enzyme [Pseudonocardia sp. HH130629-09]KAA1035430.1 iron-sulfur cluster assembly protein [Pseudonocardia sp. EV170527-09]
MTPRPAESPLRQAVWSALGTVLDPELDEPITELDFVESWTVSPAGEVTVGLRLPTFFCAPNFSFLMVADAYDAVTAVPGVTRAEVTLADHHASDEINGGVAAHAGFVKSFEGSINGEAAAELDELRHTFLAKAALAGQDRVARPLVDAGRGPDELAGLTLGELAGTEADTEELTRMRTRRRTIGLPAGDDAPLLIHSDGTAVTVEQVPLHLRRARLQRVGIETNGEYCKGLLKIRYETGRTAATAGR